LYFHAGGVCGGLPLLPDGAAWMIRNLTAGEILAQVLLPLENTKTQLAPPFEAQGKQTNIVLMGQGAAAEFEPVMAAVGFCSDPGGMGISPKHVTLSTSGIVPGASSGWRRRGAAQAGDFAECIE